MYHWAIKTFLITMTLTVTQRPTPNPIRQQLRQLRGKRTQGEIAKAVGVSDAAVSLWENGGKISREHAELYDRALGADGEALVLLGYGDQRMLTTIDAKLDRLIRLVEDLADKPGRHRNLGDATPAEMPRQVLRPR